MAEPYPADPLGCERKPEMPESLILVVGERDVSQWPQLRLHSGTEAKIVPRAYMPQAKSQEWETPRDLFDKLWDEFGGFDLDPCCLPEHYTAQRILNHNGWAFIPVGLGAVGHYCPDGLTRDWHGKVYMNPPYGAALRQWVPKAVQEVECGNAELVVALLPSRTDVKWWQEYAISAVKWSDRGGLNFGVDGHPLCEAVRFLGKRLKFGGAKDSATFPSAIVVWRK